MNEDITWVGMDTHKASISVDMRRVINRAARAGTRPVGCRVARLSANRGKPHRQPRASQEWRSPQCGPSPGQEALEGARRN